jgi:hypothetical protein
MLTMYVVGAILVTLFLSALASVDSPSFSD